MSFILDALKKSESERQRQTGPALFEVKVAPPRHRFAIWAIALGALLAINLVVVGWMLSRSSSARSAARTAAAPAPGATGASDMAPGTAAAPGTAPAPGAAAAPGTAPASAPVVAAAARRPPDAGSPAAPGTGAIPNAGAATAAPAAPAESVQSAGPEAVARSDASAPPAASGIASAAATNPEDLAPAVEPPQGSAVPASGGSVVRETASGLPSYQDAAAVPGADIPPLRLDLHVYSAKPDQRFVFLNMVKLHEGEALPQGVRVDAITPDGVILSYHGARFVLQRQ